VVIEGIGQDAAGHQRLSWRIFTDLDLARAAADLGSAGTVGELASGHIETIEPGTSLADAARVMSETGANHLVVIHAERPIGILSSADIARVIAWGG
jgi:CBS domain-containing protein